MAAETQLQGVAMGEEEAREAEARALALELERLLAQAEACTAAARSEASDPTSSPASTSSHQSWRPQAQAGSSRRAPQAAAAEAQDWLAALRQLRRRLDTLHAEEQISLPPDAPAWRKDSLPALLLLQKLDTAYERLQRELRAAQAALQQPVTRSSREQQLLSQRAQLLGQGQDGKDGRDGRDGRDGGAGKPLRRRQLSTAQDRVAAAADVTQSLQRTRQVMAQEVQRGLGTMEVLDDSSRTLQRSSREYRQQKGKLGTAQSRLTAMQRMDRQDRLILLAGSLFFCAVCTYILYSRIPLIRGAISLVVSFFRPRHRQGLTEKSFGVTSVDPTFQLFDDSGSPVPQQTCSSGIC